MSMTERPYLDTLADALLAPGQLPAAQFMSLYLGAEATDFLRFNHALVRQATHVQQGHVTLSLSEGLRAAQATLTLSGEPAQDITMLRAEQARLAQILPLLPEDPYLLRPGTVTHSQHEQAGQLPSAAQVIDAVATHAHGLDLVGFYAAGPVARAYADSRGQRNWHRVESYSFECCLYLEGDKAVKTSLAGTHWAEADLARRVQQAASQLALLGRPARTLSPGRYRAYLAPAAVAELLGTLAWGGFSLKEQRLGTSPLGRLVQGSTSLHPMVQLSEATALGTAPAFTPDGFTRPAHLPLVADGRHAGSLCAARTAREFGLQPNGASDSECPVSLAMAPGQLPESQALAALGTGLYLSNLHYLNYSDRQTCRLTGMTRFACFWVEDGQLQAPLKVMRFDDDLLRLLGADLLALGDEAHPHPDTATYGARQLGGITAPGALVAGFELTL